MRDDENGQEAGDKDENDNGNGIKTVIYDKSRNSVDNPFLKKHVWIDNRQTESDKETEIFSSAENYPMVDDVHVERI